MAVPTEALCAKVGAESRTRTGTSVSSRDFKSLASTIPPSRQPNFLFKELENNLQATFVHLYFSSSIRLAKLQKTLPILKMSDLSRHSASRDGGWRRHPESNRGSRFCRPLPYLLAMPPLFSIKVYYRFSDRLTTFIFTFLHFFLQLT